MEGHDILDLCTHDSLWPWRSSMCVLRGVSLPFYVSARRYAFPASREVDGPKVDQAVVGFPVPVGDSMVDSVDLIDTEVR